MIKAIIFDLDGVLLETEPQTFNFFKEYLKDFGVYLKDQDLSKKIGRKSVDFFNDVLNPEQLKQINTRELIELKRNKFHEDLQKYTRAIPFAKQVVDELKSRGLKLGLASQNEDVMIRKVLGWLDLKDDFQTVLTLQDIQHKKPHPEIYQMAMARLQVAPGESMVVEDSLTGIEAAKASGARVVALRHPYTPFDHIVKADDVITDLRQILDLS